jgi:DNA-binding response OmpR family regulator
LHLEDNTLDADLVRLTLQAQGIVCQLTCVRTAAAFRKSLEQGAFDLILSDFTLPGFDGLVALKAARERWPNKPFLFVSGSIGEEVAVRSLKEGATDYVVKDNLIGLGAAIRRAIRQAHGPV